MSARPIETLRHLRATEDAASSLSRLWRDVLPAPAQPTRPTFHASRGRRRAVALLCEGMSIRAVSRLTGLHKNTLLRLLLTVGTKCRQLSDSLIQNVQSARVQCDEIWSFVGAKQKHVPEEKRGIWGDCWTWTAIDADTKLILAYRVGPRTPPMAYEFMKDLASRLATPVQLTTDGLYWYVDAVDHAFGIDVAYAMIQKHYAGGIAGTATAAARYSPARFTSATKEIIRGDPDPKHISTSYVERQNLSMRMGMRRFTRLTNGFSKSKVHHAAMVSLYFMHYNFVRVHQTLRVTPAMEAGIAAEVWTVEDLLRRTAS